MNDLKETCRKQRAEFCKNLLQLTNNTESKIGIAITITREPTVDVIKCAAYSIDDTIRLLEIAIENLKQKQAEEN